MAKAYTVCQKGIRKRGEPILMCIEGPKSLIEFAAKRLCRFYALVQLQEPGEKPGELRRYFQVRVCDRQGFMDLWKVTKTIDPRSEPVIEHPRTTADAGAVEQAKAELKEAENALARAMAKAVDKLPLSQSSRGRTLSSLRGDVRRTHRQLVVNQQLAQVLAALFEDKAFTIPRKMRLKPVIYKTPTGELVTRQQCRAAAIEHWNSCVKSHRLDAPIGPVTPAYAKKVIAMFGSLEIYLSFMKVGRATEMRLPVIEKALDQLKVIPANIQRSEVLSAYDVAIKAVNEFASWLEMVNAMYHSDVLRIVEGITEMQTFRKDLYSNALIVLNGMRAKLIKPDIRPEKSVNDSFTISVCQPQDDISPPEEAA